MGGCPHGPVLCIVDWRIVENPQQALGAVLHHFIQRHGEFLFNAGWRLLLNPVQQFNPKGP